MKKNTVKMLLGSCFCLQGLVVSSVCCAMQDNNITPAAMASGGVMRNGVTEYAPQEDRETTRHYPLEQFRSDVIADIDHLMVIDQAEAIPELRLNSSPHGDSILRNVLNLNETGSEILYNTSAAVLGPLELQDDDLASFLYGLTKHTPRVAAIVLIHLYCNPPIVSNDSRSAMGTIVSMVHELEAR